jgi:hypothetical protein
MQQPFDAHLPVLPSAMLYTLLLLLLLLLQHEHTSAPQHT